MAIKFQDYDFTDLKNYPNIGYDKDNQLVEFSFDGNPLLRPYNSKKILSEDAQAEIEKCRNDKMYFFETYCYIHTQDHGKIIITLRDYQKDFLKMIDENNRIIGLLSRQIGKTTLNALEIVWNLIFQKDWIALVVANELDLKLEIVAMIQGIYENLPAFLQIGVKKWNMSSMELANGNKLRSAVAGKNAGRGKTPNYVLLDEAAWIDEIKIKAFLDAVKPALSSGSNNKFVIISTPNGYNTFHKYWKDAKEKISGFKTFFANWKSVKGRDEKWKEKTIKEDNLTPMEWAQNHLCSFIGSSSTLLSVESLSTLTKINPIVDDYLYPNVKLYKEYNDESIYVGVLDSSKTVGKTDAENDYLCFNILELSEKKIEQVLTYRTNDIHYTDMSKIIYELSEEFGFPWVVVENNEGAGQSIVDNLKNVLDYPNVYHDPMHDGEIAGIRTKSSNRMIGLQTLKKLIDSNIFKVNNDDTVDEFFTFIKIGKKFQASVNSTDDCIMSLNLLMYFLMDDMNELEITLKDYLEDSVNINKSSSNDDVDFFIGLSQEDIDSRWLLEGKDF
jgi:hypothetical protein